MSDQSTGSLTPGPPSLLVPAEQQHLSPGARSLPEPESTAGAGTQRQPYPFADCRHVPRPGTPPHPVFGRKWHHPPAGLHLQRPTGGTQKFLKFCAFPGNKQKNDLDPSSLSFSTLIPLLPLLWCLCLLPFHLNFNCPALFHKPCHRGPRTTLSSCT